MHGRADPVQPGPSPATLRMISAMSAPCVRVWVFRIAQVRARGVNADCELSRNSLDAPALGELAIGSWHSVHGPFHGKGWREQIYQRRFVGWLLSGEARACAGSGVLGRFSG